MTHAGGFAWTAGFYRGIEGHDHLLGLYHMLFGIRMRNLFIGGSLLFALQFEGVLIGFELQFEAKIGTDVGPARANVFDGG